ncbi:MAG: S8 family serine peptidase [Bacillota bacterium]|nr:S8 family serine peptidase [Bacillota bacterium]
MTALRKFWTLLTAVLVLLGSAGATALAAPSGGKPIALTVVFNGNVNAGVLANIQATGAQVVKMMPELGAATVKAPASAIPSLQQVGGVQAVAPQLIWKLKASPAVPLAEPSALAGPGDIYNVYQWDIKMVTQNGASWTLNTGSHQTVVGIIDTGVDPNHRDLRANFLGGQNFVPAGAYGDPTETGDPNDIYDRHGHGTHVAGSIAGNGRIYGVGPDLGFRAYRVFGAEGGASTEWIAAAVVAATNDGVDVISMSLGGYDVNGQVLWTDPDTGVTYHLGNDHADMILWKRALTYAQQRGVVVVAAAGNEALNAADPKAGIQMLNEEYGIYGYTFLGAVVEAPGGISGVIAVSALGPDKSLASYSNWGQGFVTLAAPGGDFQRYPEPDWFLDMCLSSYPGGAYAFMAGTSMATPKVAAVAALYIDQYKKTHGGQKPGPQQVLQGLKNGTEILGKNGGRDPFFGYGLVNAYKTLGGR